MKSAIRTRCLASALLVAAIGPAHAADRPDRNDPCMSFSQLDADRNGYLSLDEFRAKGKDDLAYRAADIDGDGRIDPDEFDKYVSKQKRSGPAGDGPPRSAPPSGRE